MEFLERWEYDMVILPLRELDAPYGGEPRLRRDLNARGAEGWELVSTVLRGRDYDRELVCVLKRRLVE